MVVHRSDCVCTSIHDTTTYEWSLNIKGSNAFDLLRDANYPEAGAFDISKHILGGFATALCGVRTGAHAPISGEILYCDRCLQASVNGK